MNVFVFKEAEVGVYAKQPSVNGRAFGLRKVR